MTIFHVTILAIVLLQAACVGPRTYTEQEKSVLAQTKTVWVEVRSDSGTSRSGMADTVEHDVKDKLMRAGLTIAPDRSTADAVLQLFFDFSDRRYLDDPSRSEEGPDWQVTRSMHIGASLDHKEVGQVFWHRSSVSLPYDMNLSHSDAIRHIDSDVLQALFKSAPPGIPKE